MIRYAYNRQMSPPAPFVHVTVGCSQTGMEIGDLPAQLDTAADRTVVPLQIVSQLGLVPLDEVTVSDFGGQILLSPTYRVVLTVRNSQRQIVEVIAYPDESMVLLGRDVLNQFRIMLDGPGLALELA